VRGSFLTTRYSVSWNGATSIFSVTRSKRRSRWQITHRYSSFGSGRVSAGLCGIWLEHAGQRHCIYVVKSGI